MDKSRITPELIERTKEFHGHWCPGLAIGIRAAEYALKEMGKAPDEEIVALVETDMCAVDAIQFLVGCTFGKGNLIHRDFGKNAFSFYRRSDGKAIRLVARPIAYGTPGPDMVELRRKLMTTGLTDEERRIWEETRAAVSKRIMELPLEDLFDVKRPVEPMPRKARIMASLICESCGEAVMETRTRRFEDKILCIPCFDIASRNGGGT